jgi:hypothetical protein
MTTPAIYYRWLRHPPTGRATIVLWTNRQGLLLPATGGHRPSAWTSRHRLHGTDHPWIELRAEEESETLPSESVLQWTLYEWIYLRFHLTAQVEQTDDETRHWVCLMWQAQAPHRIPITMVVRDQQDTRRWGQPYSTRQAGERRVCCWFDGAWTASWDVAQIPTVELPANPTQKSRHVVDPGIEAVSPVRAQAARPRFARRRE